LEAPPLNKKLLFKLVVKRINNADGSTDEVKPGFSRMNNIEDYSSAFDQSHPCVQSFLNFKTLFWLQL